MTPTRRAPSFRRPRSRLGVLAAALVVFATACAGPREYTRPDGTTVQSSRAASITPTQFFGRAYEEISGRYIEPVDLRHFAGGGIAGLAQLDGRIGVRRTDTRLEILDGAVVTASYDLPRRDDTQRWAQLTAAAIDSARGFSPTLRDTSNERLYRAVMDAALAPYDGYTRYEDPARARELRAQRDGFGGIGVVLRFDQGNTIIENLALDSPAARAGLRVGDRLVAADGHPLSGLPDREVITRLRGPIGSEVRVEARRAGSEARIEVRILRAHVVPPTVTYRRDGDIAYIRVSGFNQRTTETLADALRRAKTEIGPALTGAVIDLRGNLGGLLDQAVGVTDMFLARGTIVTTRGRHRGSFQSMSAQRGDVGEDLPLVVLINGQSASASEIVAAALQDHGRAVVVGTTSFGKGSVQTLVGLPNEGELAITWARFHAPTGYPLAELGVMPAVCTAGEADVQRTLQAIRQGRTTTPETMARWRAADHANKAELARLRALCAPDNGTRDSDVQIAEALLRDRALFARALESVQHAAQAR